jgi:hypothetical protein
VHKNFARSVATSRVPEPPDRQVVLYLRKTNSPLVKMNDLQVNELQVADTRH